MPIKLIKKITSKLTGGASSSKPKPKTKPEANAAGSAPLPTVDIAAGDGEVWRPGDGPGPKRHQGSGERSRSSRPSGNRRRSRGSSKSSGASRASTPAAADPRASRASDDSQAKGDRPRRSRSGGGSSGNRSRGSRRPRNEQGASDRTAPKSRPDEQARQSDSDRPRPPRQSKKKGPTLAERHAQWSPDQFVVEPEEGKTRFHDLDLPGEILHAIQDLGFQYCTPIQAGVLVSARKGRNVIGQAQTGTGKTAAFLVATFARFHDNPKEVKIGQPRALVIAPTRELVVQIAKDAKGLVTYSGIHCEAIYGGMDLEKQRKRLQAGPIELVAATPGRLLDFVNRRVLDLSQIEVLVIDEADRMLDMGFIPDVRRIVRATPRREQRQTLFFSATMSDDVKRLSDQWAPDPVTVEIEPEHVAVDTVKQLIYVVRTSEKFKVLYNILKLDHVGRVLIFSNRRVSTERLVRELQSRGIDCELLSGAVNQNKRMRVLEDFKSGKVSVVVATDVAGRGLHVDGIDHVINYDFPYEPDDYVHRIGRTGRAGAEGTAISFACEDESFIIPDIEKYIGEELVCKQPEEMLLKEAPRPFRKPTVTTDSTRSDRGGGRGRPGGGRRPSGGGGRRPSGGGRRPSGGPRRSSPRSR